MARPKATGTRHPNAHSRRRLRRVRRPRLRRHDRRSHRPPRPRQQGDDLLPLPEQARPLHLHHPRRLHAHHRAACAPRWPRTRRPRRNSSVSSRPSCDRSMRPTHFLPIFLREIADGGAHLGAEELALLAGIFAAVQRRRSPRAPNRGRSSPSIRRSRTSPL